MNIVKLFLHFFFSFSFTFYFFLQFCERSNAVFLLFYSPACSNESIFSSTESGSVEHSGTHRGMTIEKDCNRAGIMI